MQEENNIVKFHRQIHINVGFVICLIIFIYILFHLYTYLTKNQISVYEVRQGQIVSNYEYQALALRDETVVYTDRSGYPFFYKMNQSKASVRTTVYAMDDTGDVVKRISDRKKSEDNLSSNSIKAIKDDIYAYVNTYDPNRFQRVYDFKTDISDSLSENYNMIAKNALSTEIENAISQDKYHEYNAPVPGFLVYQTDGFEGLTKETLSGESMDSGNLKVSSLRVTDKVEAGTPVYKLITGDSWDLVIDVEKEVLEGISEGDRIKVHFDDDDSYTYGTASFIQNAGKTYLDLTLNDSVERFADQRFIAVELMLAKKTGLKIPNSAIVEKTFFTVPKEYFFKGNDSDDIGVLKQEDGNTTSFVSPTIYYETEDAYYIDSEYLSAEDVLIKPDSKATYKVRSNTDKLKGVYNINKGYAVFKQIEIIYESDDYSIIKTGTSYGISLYDRIVLQGNNVEENEIL